MDSKTRKATLYFLTSLSIEKFHDKRTQIGIRKAVSKINNRLNPSIPSVKLMFEKGIQEIS